MMVEGREGERRRATTRGRRWIDTRDVESFEIEVKDNSERWGERGWRGGRQKERERREESY